jgi:hypothetical protein
VGGPGDKRVEGRWNLRYFMAETPTKFPTPPNQFLTGDT